MNISIIEFIVYAIPAYTSLGVLIYSVIIPEQPKTKARTLVKSMYMIPGIICCILLAGSGVVIFLDTGSVTITEVYNGSDSSLITNSTETRDPSSVTLQNPIWITLHYMFALILVAFVFTQILQLFTSRD